MSRTNEKRNVSLHGTCTFKSKLDASVYNEKQRWNNNKWRYECKELIDKSRCDDEFIWNPSICECVFDKSCNAREYLDFENCKYRKELIDKLVLECEDEILNAIPLNITNTISITEKNKCLIYIILLTIMCLISLAIVSINCCY